MTHAYRWVQWNTHKRRYDAFLLVLSLVYLLTFFVVSALAFNAPRQISPPILAIRAFGSLAIIMLHVILLIGPLARMTPLAAPLLYNRRHLGVAFLIAALLHGMIAMVYYGGFGVRNPVSATVAGYGAFSSVSGFPFEFLGFVALLIFFVLAATSHDFWLANLSASVWKSLHMLVYVAYGLVVLHVAFGALQSERHDAYSALLIAGVVLVAGAHVIAAMLERRRASVEIAATSDWIDACAVEDIGEGAAVVVTLKHGERIAIFRYGGRVSAVSNVCAHQGGPLGEGRVIEGCITCPWHGYQYQPADGASPPPYSEKIPTYQVRIESGRVLVNPGANAPGTHVEPAQIEGVGRAD